MWGVVLAQSRCRNPRGGLLAAVDLHAHGSVAALVTAAAEAVSGRPLVVFHTDATTSVVGAAVALVVPGVAPAVVVPVAAARLANRVAAPAVLPRPDVAVPTVPGIDVVVVG